MSVSGAGGSRPVEPEGDFEAQAAEEVKEYNNHKVKKEKDKTKTDKSERVFKQTASGPPPKPDSKPKARALKSIDRKFFKEQTKHAFQELRQIRQQDRKRSAQKNEAKDDETRRYLLDQLRKEAKLKRPEGLSAYEQEMAEKLRELRNLREEMIQMIDSQNVADLNFVLDKPALLDPDAVNKLLVLEKEFRNLISGWGHKPNDYLHKDLEKALERYQPMAHDVEA